MSKERRLVWVCAGACAAAALWGCTRIVGVDLDYHALGDGGTIAPTCDASFEADAGMACAAGQGAIVATVVNVPGGADRGALMAVAGGRPNVQMGPTAFWTVEKAKTWHAVKDEIPFVAGSTSVYSVCLPAGDYTLQIWDRFGGGGNDNGVPPSVTYVWQIGNASRTLTVPSGGAVPVTLTVTNVDVPANDNFYGSWTLWDYGPCACDAGCPAGTTCQKGTCVDPSFDVRHCGAAGSVCNAQDCCDGACVDPASSPAHCGSCGNACTAPQACTSGACK